MSVAAFCQWNGPSAGLLELVFDGVVLDGHDFGALGQGGLARATLRGAVPHVSAGLHELRLRVRGANPATLQYFDDVVLSGSAVPAPPLAPTSLGVTGASAGRIDLAWADASMNEVGFRVERSPRGGASFVEVGRVGADVTTFSDATARPGAAYEYRVFATNAGGDSLASAVASSPLPARPSAPTSVVASTGGAALVALTWVDRSTNELGFLVERRPQGGWFYAPLAVVPPNTTTLQDLWAAPFAGYDYRVSAFNDAGASSLARVSATAGGLRLAPTAPAGLTAVAAPGGVLLTWQGSGGDETGFRVERCVRPPSWSHHVPPFDVVDVAPAGASSHVDASAAPGVEYLYRLVRTRAGAESPPSVQAPVVFAWAPASPTALRAAARDPLRVQLTWTDVADDESGYRIERRLVGGTFATVAALPADATSWLDGDLLPGQSVEYRVIASRPDGAPSNVAGATTPPALLINGDFECLDLRGWTRFGPTDVVKVGPNRLDVDGDGRASYCVNFSEAGYGQQVGLLQQVELAAGSLELSVVVLFSNGSDGTVSLVLDGAVVASHSGGGRVVLRATAPAVTRGRHEVRLMVERAGPSVNYTTRFDFDDLVLGGSAVPPRPAAPTRLTAARVSNGVDLSWTDAATNERGFRIERSPAGGGSFLEIGRAVADATAFLDRTAVAGLGYEYRVLATNERGDSDASGVTVGP